MSHNTLVEKIEADAKAAVAEVQGKQAVAIEAIESETATKVADLQTTHQKQLEKKLSHMELVALSRAKQSANIAVQSAKREEIDGVFATVKEELANLPADQYVAFFAARLKTVVGGSVEITDVHTAPGKESEAEQILKEAGLSGDITADKTISAGVIIYTKDGVYDATLGRIFAENKAEMEMEVVTALTS